MTSPPPPAAADQRGGATARTAAAETAPAQLTAPAPLFHLALRLDGQPCLVVGGGRIGARKAAALIECGAVVTLVSPETCPLVDELPVAVERRPYQSGEAAGYRLVVTATGIAEVDRAVFLDAEAAGVLVNAADDPASCSFLMPAVLRQGDVSVAVSTAGVSPWLAGWLRSRIGDVVGPEVADLAVIVGEARAAIRCAGLSSEGLDWGELVEQRLWPLLLRGDVEAARSAAAGWVHAVLAAPQPPPGSPDTPRG